jgi:hypothetical protein
MMNLNFLCGQKKEQYFDARMFIFLNILCGQKTEQYLDGRIFIILNQNIFHISLLKDETNPNV